MMSEERKKQDMPNMMKSTAVVMAADMFLIVGFLFLLLGLSKFINDFLEIPGVGEGSLGIILIVIGVLVLAQSKMKIRMRPVMGQQQMSQMPQQPQPPQPPPAEVPPGTYR